MNAYLECGGCDAALAWQPSAKANTAILGEISAKSACGGCRRTPK